MPEVVKPLSPRRALLAVAPAIVVAAAIYLPARGGFFLGEDLVNLYKARHSTVAALFSPSTTAFLNPHYRPLWHVAYRGLDEVFGFDPVPFHLASLTLHLMAVALAGLVARRLGLGRIATGTAGALVAWHPASSQPVLWISSLNVVLGAVLVLLALERALAWFQSSGGESGAVRRHGGGGSLWVAAAAFAGALGTQEFAYSLPLVFLLAGALVRPRPLPGRWPRAFLVAAAGLILAGGHFFFLERGLQGRLAGDVGGGGPMKLLTDAGGYLLRDLGYVWGGGILDLGSHPVLATVLVGSVALALAVRLRGRAAALVLWCLAAPFPSALADAAWRHVYLAIVPASLAAVFALEGAGQALGALAGRRGGEAAGRRRRGGIPRGWRRALAALAALSPAAFPLAALPLAAAMASRIPAEVASWRELSREGEDAFHAVGDLLATLPAGEPAPVLVNLPACHRGVLLHFAGPEGEGRFGMLYFLETDRYLYSGARLQDCVRRLEAEGRAAYLFRRDRFVRLLGDSPVRDRVLVPESFLAREVRDPGDGRGAAREVLASRDDPTRVVWIEGLGRRRLHPAADELEEREAWGGCAEPAPGGGWIRRYRVRTLAGAVLVVLHPYLPVLDPLGRRLDPGGALRRPYLGLLRATIDGAPQPLFRAQAFFSAIPIRPGPHEVEIRWGA